MPWMSAPIFTSMRARSWTWGSHAALPITVVPGVSAAAISAFSVAITEGSSMNTSVGRSPRGALSTISPSHSTRAPIARKASRWGSRRRRPITSPPGGGITARWKRASSGPASRNEARISSASSALDLDLVDARGAQRYLVGPAPGDRRRRSRAGSRASPRRRGCAARCRTSTSSSVRTQEARIGSAPFLFPAGTIVPDSGTPPSMTNFSMSLGRRRRASIGPLAGRPASVTAISAVKFEPAAADPACLLAASFAQVPAGSVLQLTLQPALPEIGSGKPFSGHGHRTYTRSRRRPSESGRTLRTHVPHSENINACTARARCPAPDPLVPAARGRLRQSTGRSTRTSISGATPAPGAAARASPRPPARHAAAASARVPLPCDASR